MPDGNDFSARGGARRRPKRKGSTSKNALLGAPGAPTPKLDGGQPPNRELQSTNIKDGFSHASRFGIATGLAIGKTVPSGGSAGFGIASLLGETGLTQGALDKGVLTTGAVIWLDIIVFSVAFFSNVVTCGVTRGKAIFEMFGINVYEWEWVKNLSLADDDDDATKAARVARAVAYEEADANLNEVAIEEALRINADANAAMAAASAVKAIKDMQRRGFAISKQQQAATAAIAAAIAVTCFPSRSGGPVHRGIIRAAQVIATHFIDKDIEVMVALAGHILAAEAEIMSARDYDGMKIAIKKQITPATREKAGAFDLDFLVDDFVTGISAGWSDELNCEAIFDIFERAQASQPRTEIPADRHKKNKFWQMLKTALVTVLFVIPFTLLYALFGIFLYLTVKSAKYIWALISFPWQIYRNARVNGKGKSNLAIWWEDCKQKPVEYWLYNSVAMLAALTYGGLAFVGCTHIFVSIGLISNSIWMIPAAWPIWLFVLGILFSLSTITSFLAVQGQKLLSYSAKIRLFLKSLFMTKSNGDVHIELKGNVKKCTRILANGHVVSIEYANNLSRRRLLVAGLLGFVVAPFSNGLFFYFVLKNCALISLLMPHLVFATIMVLLVASSIVFILTMSISTFFKFANIKHSDEPQKSKNGLSDSARTLVMLKGRAQDKVGNTKIYRVKYRTFWGIAYTDNYLYATISFVGAFTFFMPLLMPIWGAWGVGVAVTFGFCFFVLNAYVSQAFNVKMFLDAIKRFLLATPGRDAEISEVNIAEQIARARVFVDVVPMLESGSIECENSARALAQLAKAVELVVDAAEKIDRVDRTADQINQLIAIVNNLADRVDGPHVERLPDTLLKGSVVESVRAKVEVERARQLAKVIKRLAEHVEAQAPAMTATTDSGAEEAEDAPLLADMQVRAAEALPQQPREIARAAAERARVAADDGRNLQVFYPEAFMRVFQSAEYAVLQAKRSVVGYGAVEMDAVSGVNDSGGKKLS